MVSQTAANGASELRQQFSESELLPYILRLTPLIQSCLQKLLTKDQ